MIISGEHDITSGALRLLFSNEIDTIILDSYGNPLGYLLPCGRSKLFERYEVQKNLSQAQALKIAKIMSIASITNKVSLLRSIEKNTAIGIDREIASISEMIEKVESCNDVDSLRGIEGFSTNEYYQALQKIIPAKFNFTGRNRNPPLDPVNAMLGYGYGILYSRIRSAVVKAGLSPYYGIMHSTYKNQEALVYDLIEEFRQPVVDRAMLTLIARKQVSLEDFKTSSEGCLLSGNFKKQYASSILTRLDQEYNFEGKNSFSEIIDLQAEKLAAAVLDSGRYSPFIYR